MLKKQKENSGLLALVAGRLAKCRDRAQTVTCCLSSLGDGEMKREQRVGEARRGSDMLMFYG